MTSLAEVVAELQERLAGYTTNQYDECLPPSCGDKHEDYCERSYTEYAQKELDALTADPTEDGIARAHNVIAELDPDSPEGLARDAANRADIDEDLDSWADEAGVDYDDVADADADGAAR